MLRLTVPRINIPVRSLLSQHRFSNLKNIQINNSGQLEIVTQWGVLIQEIPESYQIIDGQKKLIKITILTK